MNNSDSDLKAAADTSTTNDDYLHAVTIGERSILNNTVDIVPYDPAWPTRFVELANEIRAAIGEQVLLLEHVGSTSVPGLAAKPVIDIVLAVTDAAHERAYVSALEQRGFVLRIREPDWFEHRMFKTPGHAGNLHVFSEGCDEIQRMLVFRDWLRTHVADRELYETTKRRLAAMVWQDIQHYADAKTLVVQEILARAMPRLP